MSNPVQPRFRVEHPLPGEEIVVYGNHAFSRATITSVFVVDTYSGLCIGTVVASRDWDVRTAPDGHCIDPPSGGWKRVDQAAASVWQTYNRTFPKRERLRRWVWRWAAVGWLLFGVVAGVAGSAIVAAIGGG